MSVLESERGYDIIGDVHGCALTVERLLDQMGYRKKAGVWQHANRQALFLGDIIDRGPRIREALHLVRDMVEAGSARCIMGNHEFNALCWATPAPADSGRAFMREHNERHHRLIGDTLDQFADWPDEWQAFLDWFYELPLFLDCHEIRLVHACWDDRLIQPFRAQHPDGCIDRDFLLAAGQWGSFESQTLDRLLRGTDMRLPDGISMTGKDGFTRGSFRTKYWEESPRTYGDVVFQPDALPEEVAALELSEEQKAALQIYRPEDPILFVGHYWQQGAPQPIRPNLACLDYSAVKYGKLVAYRWDGERRLNPDHFVWVDVPQYA